MSLHELFNYVIDYQITTEGLIHFGVYVALGIAFLIIMAIFTAMCTAIDKSSQRRASERLRRAAERQAVKPRKDDPDWTQDFAAWLINGKKAHR